jgi:hypothetical protein
MVMKSKRNLWINVLGAAALVVSSLPAAAGVSIDRNSPSVAVCPTDPSHVFRPAGPNNGCDIGGPGPVIDTAALSYGIPVGDDVDDFGTNEAGAANVNYRLMFSGDMISVGVGVYNAEFLLTQSAADIYRTNNLTSVSPRAVMAGACAAPALVGGVVVVANNQGQFNLIPSVNAGVPPPLNPNPDDVDGFERDVLDVTGDQANDVQFYFTVDAASVLAPPSDIMRARVGMPPVLWAPAAMLGLGAGNDVDALVVWDRGVAGVANAGPDLVLFSLNRGSAALAGPDAILGTADDYSPADVFVSDLTGMFCLYTRFNQVGLLFNDNLDALDVTP